MANKLFGLNIAKIVSGAMPGMFAGTLNSFTPGTRTVGNPGGGTNPTPTPYSFKGFASTFKKHASSLVVDATHTVVILVGSMVDSAPVPKPDDTIVFAAGTDPQLGGKTCIIVEDGVERDPATATYICHVEEQQ